MRRQAAGAAAAMKKQVDAAAAQKKVCVTACFFLTNAAHFIFALKCWFEHAPRSSQHDVPPQGPSSLAAMLAQATPEQQKQMLGERLYMLIVPFKSQLAGKITGMLLEGLNTAELLGLIDSPIALHEKIKLAVDAIESAAWKKGHGKDMQPAVSDRGTKALTRGRGGGHPVNADGRTYKPEREEEEEEQCLIPGDSAQLDINFCQKSDFESDERRRCHERVYYYY